MDPFSLLVAIWFVLFIAAVVVKVLLKRALRTREDEEKQDTGDGFAPPLAWSELDTFAMRYRSGHPLQ